MNKNKYKNIQEMKKFAEENPNLVVRAYRDLQIFLKLFIGFIAIGVIASTYYLVKVMML